MQRGLEGADIVMMLRLQTERMQGSFVPSVREYFHFFGLDLRQAARGQARRADHASRADEPRRRDRRRGRRRHRPQRHPGQVEMGVAVRMAVPRRADPRPARAARMSRPVADRQRPPARPGDRARRAAAALLIVGGRIAEVGPGVTAALAPGGAEVIDATGPVPGAGPGRHARPARRARGRAQGADRQRRRGRGRRRRHQHGRPAQHRPADRRPGDGRVRGPPRAPGEARQGLSLRRDHQAAARARSWPRSACSRRPARSPSPTASGRWPTPG